MKLQRSLFAAAWILVLLASCTPAVPEPAPAGPPAVELTPFLTYTPGVAAPPHSGQLITATFLPSPTPTPRTYIIQSGEDMGGIAYRFKVTLAALMAANPDIDPRLLKVGSTLIIPASSVASPTEGIPSPTPVGLKVGPGVCTQSQDGGAWCFAMVTNQQKNAVESITALMRLSNAASGKTYTRIAQTPLDLLPAGASLPLAAYFPPPAAGAAQVSVELRTALPVAPDDGRYLTAAVAPGQLNITPDGLSAAVTGQIRLTAKKGTASQVWLALIAYAASGQVVGVRRWQNSGRLAAGEVLDFSVFVYSTGEKITRVETQAEARP